MSEMENKAELMLTYRGTVYPWQCDHMGHMNVMWYAGKFDEATWQMFSILGVSPTYMREEKRGVAAVRQNTTYRQELKAGDLVTIRTCVLEMRERSIRFYHEMMDDVTGKIAATTVITGVHIDAQTRKPHPFPDEIIQRGLNQIVDYNPVS